MYVFSNINDVKLPVLEDGQYYIYVLLNHPQGNIKVGRTSNIQQRLQSLSGSNGGGNKIVKIAVSDSTYLYTLERIIHFHFRDSRISGTEWFTDDFLQFETVVSYVESLFSSREYILCNQIRKDFVAKHGVCMVNSNQDDSEKGKDDVVWQRQDFMV